MDIYPSFYKVSGLKFFWRFFSRRSCGSFDFEVVEFRVHG